MVSSMQSLLRRLPPPRKSVGKFSSKIFDTHAPRPFSVKLPEPNGSPLRLSAPHCTTTASAANAFSMQFNTLETIEISTTTLVA